MQDLYHQPYHESDYLVNLANCFGYSSSGPAVSLRNNLYMFWSRKIVLVSLYTYVVQYTTMSPNTFELNT